MKIKLDKLCFPIIQAPMAGGILDASFVSNICNRGFLGFIPSGYLSLNALEQFIVAVKSGLNSLDQPFGVNIFIEDDRLSDQYLTKPEQFKKFELSLGFNSTDTFLIPKTVSEESYIDLFIKHNVPVVSSTFGFFSQESIKKLKKNGIIVIGNATSVEEFLYCCYNGADAVVVQGFEAGGHQASFLSKHKNITSTLELTKACRHINNQMTIISAGGISASNYKHFFSAGADFIQLGTLFMMSEESSLPQHIKQFIVSNHSRDITLTKTITGKYARGINNNLFSASQEFEFYNFPIQHYLTAPVRQYAKQNHLVEYASLWLGSNRENMTLHRLDDIVQMFYN